MLGRYELVVHALGFVLCAAQECIQTRREVDLQRPIGLGHALQFALELARDVGRVESHLGQNLRHDAILLLQERSEQVLDVDLCMVTRFGQLLGGHNRFLCFLCVFV